MKAIRGLVLLALLVRAGSCGSGRSTPRANGGTTVHATPEGAIVSEPGFPNVRARVRWSRKAPSLPDREDFMEIWMKGSRFHVRDESGRHLSEIVGDLTAPRGLGSPARTMEDFMDASSAARRKAKEGAGKPTELFGDVATDRGWVYPPKGERWASPAKNLAPAATQILSEGREAGLDSAGKSTRLGREATEYHGVLTVKDDGREFQNDVTRVIAPPFLLLDQIRDANAPERHFFVREIVSLEEGTVTDADVTPPGE
jgi:hypothetical protein